MHGPHKSRRLLVGEPDDATVRPFLVPLRCYYCATLIGQKSTLIYGEIFICYSIWGNHGWNKLERILVLRHINYARCLYTLSPPNTFMQKSLFLLLLLCSYPSGEILPRMFERISPPIISSFYGRVLRETILAGEVMLRSCPFIFARKLKICHTYSRA